MKISIEQLVHDQKISDTPKLISLTANPYAAQRFDLGFTILENY